MMSALFYLASIIALAATVLALTRANAAHALIYLIVSLLAVAVMIPSREQPVRTPSRSTVRRA